MIIKTIDELKQRIGKLVVFSYYDPNFNDITACIKLLTKIKNPTNKNVKENDIYGWHIYGNFTTYVYPSFYPATKGETFSNCFRYARDPTEQEIKMFMQSWRKIFFSGVIKPNHEEKNLQLPF